MTTLTHQIHMSDIRPEVKRIDTVYQGRVFDITVDQLEFPDGRHVKMEVVRHRGSVVLLPMPSHDRIVLVRRAIEPGYGLWVFPGGYVDQGEEVTAAAIREAREESGLEIRIDSLVNIYSYGGRSPIIIVYAATALSGDLCADDECLEAGLFRSSEIPWDALAFRSTTEALRDYFKTEWLSSKVK